MIQLNFNQDNFEKNVKYTTKFGASEFYKFRIFISVLMSHINILIVFN